MKHIKVLIVDDSLLFREICAQELSRDANISVVAKAVDAFDASRKIEEYAPDILIVDVIMERMDGLEFIKQVLPQYFVPVIVVSSDPLNRVRAESIASVQFVEKPPEGRLRQTSSFFNELLARIRAITNGEVFDPRQFERISGKLIAVGASTGGAEAIESVLTELPAMMPPIVISQHMPPKFTKSFADRLNAVCRISVKEAEDGESVIPGQAYIAPGGYHMSVRARGGRYVIVCDENISGTPICPNIDMLFYSIAAGRIDRAAGVLLTGMGRDGADGLKKMRNAGCLTIGQDERTSVVYGMPKAAYESGAVEVQLPLNRIAGKLVEFARR